MRRLALGLSLMGCLLAPATSLALGLGSMNVHTTLNQPLQADIGLVGTNPDELHEVNAHLASFKMFEQVGIPRPDYLDKLQFKVVRGSKGASYIQVTTRGAVKQPFLDFLLEVDWPGGRLVREYTVLLNPPSYLKGKPEVATTAPKVMAAPMVKRSPAPAKKPVAAPHAPTVAAATATQSSPPPAQKKPAPPSSVQQSTSKPAAMSSGSSLAQYKVRRGDTLIQVAERMRPNQATSINQVMIALLRANSDAFIHGNINGLKQGYVLRMPPAGTVAAISKGKADAEVHQQNSLWHEYATHMAGHTVAQSQLKSANHSGLIAKTSTSKATAPKASESSNSRLKIMGTKPSSSGNAKGSTKVAMADSKDMTKLKHELAIAQEGAASNKQKLSDLESRVQALQGIVNKQQNLIDLKNQQLANLQKELASNASSTQAATATAVASSSTTEKATAVAPTPTHAANTQPSKAMTASASAAAAIATPTTMAAAPATTVAAPAQVKPEKKVVPKPKPPVRKPAIEPKPAPQPSLINDLMGNPNMLMAGGGIVLLLLALLWLVARRSAKSRAAAQAAIPSSDIAADPELGMNADDFDVDLDDERVESPIAAEGEADETSEETQETRGASPSVDQERPKTVEAADDALAEADVYIAYGLYQQAEDVLRKALDAEPDRNDYRAKLVECHFGAKNVDAFESEAKQLHESLSHPETDPLWIKTATLGKELIPDNPLFTGTDTGELTSADVLSSEQPDGELDFRPDVFGGQGDAGDVGSENNADAEVLELGDLDLGESEQEALTGAKTDDAKAAEALELGDLDLGDTELDALGEEEADDTESNSLNFEAPEALELGTDEEETVASEDSLGGLDFSLDDLDISPDLQTEEVAEDKDENALESLDMASDDFDLEAETAAFGESVGSADSSETEEGFPLSGSGGDEVATKLDLAKAYIDMGDAEGAQSALEEVVTEGNDTQKHEAQELLKQLG